MDEYQIDMCVAVPQGNTFFANLSRESLLSLRVAFQISEEEYVEEFFYLKNWLSSNN